MKRSVNCRDEKERVGREAHGRRAAAVRAKPHESNLQHALTAPFVAAQTGALRDACSAAVGGWQVVMTQVIKKILGDKANRLEMQHPGKEEVRLVPRVYRWLCSMHVGKAGLSRGERGVCGRPG